MPRPHRIDLPGRPLTFDREKAAVVLERMSEGETLTAICREPDMPPMSTVRSWAGNPKLAWFGAAFAQARRDQARVLAEETIDIADKSVSAEKITQIYAAQLRVNSRRWLASRYDAETYGDKTIQPAGANATVHVYLPQKGGQPGDFGPGDRPGPATDPGPGRGRRGLNGGGWLRPTRPGQAGNPGHSASALL